LLFHSDKQALQNMLHNLVPLSSLTGSLRRAALGAMFLGGVFWNSTGFAQAELPAGRDSLWQAWIQDSTGAAPIETAPLARPEWHSMITNLPGDWIRGVKTTASVDALPGVIGISLISGALIVADQATYKMTRNFLGTHSSAESMCPFMVRGGDGRIHLAIAATFGIVGFALDDTRALRTASQTVEALLASGVVVQVLKHVTGRESPEAASKQGGVWRLLPNQRDYIRHQARYYSFPSGHIATIMSTVTVIAENYPEVGWIKPVGYTAVGLVGFSLVGVGMHWYGDLPLGLAIGYTFGKIVAHRDDPGMMAGDSAHSSAFSIVPSITPEGAGVTLAVAF
jgi:membrane-associated phospholipid phosphatase